MQSLETIKGIFSEQRLLPIIQAESIADGLEVTRAMQKSGLNVVEVVLRNQQALNLAIEIKRNFPELVLGIGTVYNTARLDDALQAGADFIVTPAVTPTLSAALANCGKPCLPGVSSLSDIACLLELGFEQMKLFPAEISGGVGMLKAVSSLFGDLSFCPTGGINADNQAAYLAQPNVFAVGGTWMVPKSAVENKQWDAITRACQQAIAIS
ncbi:bifunctional 4-hydroxy-2-oxoglutarate aldolase/2-dehydro-3-deoxy-phosphogluconate aldolase [Glaciecola sp. SC05]|uniref:bifunctional 4-hydroxy-2-oxoglutarate aldolase/2-dehydro-3-deoxy-phosphogluconate aldolase n=1 Tax=Glaciecola sp. SC05 TaxID=1987355 RepID=UPI003526F1ED